MNLVVTPQFHLNEFRASDKAALIAHLNDRDIYERTLRIPYPYTAASADQFFDRLANQQQGRPVAWAVRETDESLVGAVGLDGGQVNQAHRAEIGYWLAKSLWGQGVMTAVVRLVCRHAFGELGLTKISAQVFAGNPASARVLEKCGFEPEGFLKKQYLKDGKYIDVRLFALLK